VVKFRGTRKIGMAVRLDDLDRKILAELQADGGQSLDDIAKLVGSSKTPVWNRIRKMREAGVIRHQTYLLDAEKLGFEACFFVLIRTSEHLSLIHISEPTRRTPISYAVFCLKK